MSVNFNRAEKHKCFTNKEYISLEFKEPYWDEGLRFYPNYKPKHPRPKKRLLFYQVRRYRTWKYNRKTQYKEIRSQSLN